MKSKQASIQLKPVTRNISCIGYCYNLKPNGCTNKAHLQDLIPTLAGVKCICNQTRD